MTEMRIGVRDRGDVFVLFMSLCLYVRSVLSRIMRVKTEASA
jgi:hypothetical protein